MTADRQSAIEEWAGRARCDHPIRQPEGTHRGCQLAPRHGDDHDYRPQPFVDPDDPGTMLQAVRKDLDGIKVSEVPGGFTYAAIALHLAGVIDKRPADDGPSVTAKLADQLGKAMAALTRKAGGDDDGFDQWEDTLSTPVTTD
jgi:hypothetical protein